MSKSNRSSSLPRRLFLSGATSLAALAAASGAARAQASIVDIINSPRRGNWDDQFDAKSSRAAKQVATRVPITSTETVGYVDRAIAHYQDIVSRGGWPTLPETEKLQLGNVSPTVRTLRQRLMISGDLDRTAGISDSFDSYVDGVVKYADAIWARYGE